MQSLLKDNLPKIRELLKSYKVKRAFAFGSVCTDRFNEKSDIDILLSFDDDHIAIENYADNYFDLTYKLEELLGREVDLVTERTIKDPNFIRVMERTKTDLLNDR
jgi:uncharacterized protein